MTAGRVRVLFVSHTLAVGGAEEMLLRIVKHLPAERYDVRVCCITSEGPLGGEVRATRRPVAVLGRVPGVRDPLAVLALAREIRRFGPHVVHTFLQSANLYGRLAAILARVPVVIASEMNVYRRRKRRHILGERLLGARTAAVVAAAASVRDFYVRQVGLDPARVPVIYNTADWDRLVPEAGRAATRAALGLGDDVVVAGVVARLTEQKGHALLFEALAETPDLRGLAVLVAGQGELRGALEEQVCALGLDDRVRFLGARRDVGDIFAALDIFVLPSLWEGLPVALVEAMGAGLPVVATAVDGVPELVEDGVTGLVVPPRDPAALGKALARLVTDPAERARLGRAARDYARPRFGTEAYIRSLTALYERLLAERPA